MSLLIFTTKKDLSYSLLQDEARSRSLICKIYFYEDLSYREGVILEKDGEQIRIRTNDQLILRSPYHPYCSQLDYRFFARKLVEDHYENILLDRKCYLHFPFYEDKLFQMSFLLKHRLEVPKTFYANCLEAIKNFPVVVKRRISARCRGNQIIYTPAELKDFLKAQNPWEYIIQEYIPLQKDYRILIFKGKILGVVERGVSLKKGGRIGVEVSQRAELPSQIKRRSLKIVKLFKADFAGVDVVVSRKNRFFFLEINLSPQFHKFTQVSGINVAGQIIQYALSRALSSD